MVKRLGWIIFVYLEEGFIFKWVSQFLDILGYGYFLGYELRVVFAWRLEKCGVLGFLFLGLYVFTWVGIGRKRGFRAERVVFVFDYGFVVVCYLCRIGFGVVCRLFRVESERRCRAFGQFLGGVLCYGRGRCDCGVCICYVSESGVYFGFLCECYEWVCEIYDGSICVGKGRGCFFAGYIVSQEVGRFFFGFLSFYRVRGWGQNDFILWFSRKLSLVATVFFLLVNFGIMVCVIFFCRRV